MKPKLDKWIIYGDCLVGYLYDSKFFPQGTRIKTDVVRHVDILNSEAECLDGRYKLLEPGTEFDHKHESLRFGEAVGSGIVGDFTRSVPVEEKPRLFMIK